MDQENQPLEVRFESAIRRDLHKQLRGNKQIVLAAILFQVSLIVIVLGWHVGLIPMDHWVSSQFHDKKVETDIINDLDSVQLYAGHSLFNRDSSGTTIHKLKSKYKNNVVLNPDVIDSTSTTSNQLVFGIDVSNWQGEINWKILSNHADSIRFVIVKATQGTDVVDPMFYRNWANAKQSSLVFGAYHYFDLKADPLAQAKLYLRTTHLKKGDLLPIVDVEFPCGNCHSLGVSNDELVQNLKIFLAEVENALNVRPMIYASESFYNTYLKNDFEGYPLWVAAYEGEVPSELKEFFHYDPIHGSVWQFTDKGSVPGITGSVDLDASTSNSIEKLRIQ
jgi:lysozyme